ncbi:MAG: hypothetical protein U0900_14200 [Myxococcota bacterium]
MYRRPFLVLPGGDCIPLEGDWRIEPLRGEWYVLGHHTVFRFDSEQEALARLAHLRGEASPNAVAAFTLELDDDTEALDGAGERDGHTRADRVGFAALAPADLIGEADLH